MHPVPRIMQEVDAVAHAADRFLVLRAKGPLTLRGEAGGDVIFKDLLNTIKAFLSVKFRTI